jgi:ankyrin repeat protein
MQLFVLTALCLPGASFTSSHKSLTDPLPTLKSLFNTNDLSGKLVAGCAVGLFVGATYYCLNEHKKMLDISDLLTNPELKPGDTALHHACKIGSLNDIKKLLGHPESKDFIHTHNAQGEYPIHTACLNKNLTALKLLLSKNPVNPNALTQSGKTPLGLMCERIYTQGIISQKDIDILNTLLHNGAQYMDDNGTTFIEWMRERNLQYLFKDQISLSTDNQNIVANALESSESDNPLNDACKTNDLKKAMILLENQETFLEFAYKRDDDGRTAMHNAYRKKNFDILELFLNKGLADIPTNNGESLLDFAFSDPTKPFNRKVLNALLHHNARYIQHGTTTVLHKACEYGLIDVVEQLLENPQPVFCETETEDLPLHIACRRNNLDIVKLLLTSEDHVAHLNNQNKKGQTALYVACASDAQSEFITTLLEQGADPSFAAADGTTPLHIACLNNNIRVVRTLLESPIVLASINKHYKDGHTLLSWACAKNLSCEIITALIQGGADPGIVDSAGNTQLYTALKQSTYGSTSYQKYNNSIIEALLDSPNALKFINIKNKYGNTPLHVACAINPSPVIIAKMIKRGADVGIGDAGGNTPLHIAFGKNRNDIIIELFNSPNVSESINRQNKYGNTPLHVACTKNVSPFIITKMIEQGAHVGIVNFNGDTPLHIACQKSHANIIPALLDSPNVSEYINHQNINGNTPLHWACANDIYASIHRMLNLGADPNKVNEEGDTPLHIACKKGDTMLEILLDSTIVPITCINQKNKDGDTPLHRACTENIAADIITKMIEKGADVGMVNSTGDTPLYIACQKSHANIIPALLDSPNVSEYINLQDKDGDTPLHWACAKNVAADIITKMIEKGADPEIVNINGKTPLHTAFYNNYYDVINALLNSTNPLKYINRQDIHNNTPLHLACAKNAPIETIRTLLQRGAHIGIFNSNRDTPLHLACHKKYNNNNHIIKALLDSPNVSEYINLQDEYGNTPLHVACEKNLSTDIITKMIEKGANPKIVNRHGHTPLHIACQNRYYNLDMISTLLNVSNVSEFINLQDEFGNTPLHLACSERRHQTDIIRQMIEKGAHVGIFDSYRYTPLHVAFAYIHYDGIRALLDSPTVLESINLKNKKGKTALDFAKENDTPQDIIDKLVALGAL